MEGAARPQPSPEAEEEEEAQQQEPAWVLPRRWVEGMLVELYRLEDQNARLADRIGALQMQAQHERHLRRLCEEANQSLILKLKSAVRYLRRANMVEETPKA